MVRRRIETTPSEQLVALRKARDRYVALADQFKDSSDSVTTRLDDRQRERDARRIASAYDKSIANMAAKMVRAGKPSRTVSFFNNLGMATPIFAVAVGLLALVTFFYSGLFKSAGGNVGSPPPSHLVSPTTPPDVASAVPTPAPETLTGSRPAPTPLRATAVAEQARPTPRPAKTIRAQTRNEAEDGFVAKVLQPDGTFREEYFSAAPR